MRPETALARWRSANPGRTHVTSDPGIRGGEPCVTGTRVPAALVAGLVHDGVPPERIGDYYPSVSAEAARDAADFVAHAGDQP